MIKRKSCLVLIFICILIGVGRFLEIVYITDHATGFFTRGNLAARLIVPFLIVLLLVLLSFKLPKKADYLKSSGTTAGKALVFSGCITIFAAVSEISILILTNITPSKFLITLVLFINAIWLVYVGFELSSNRDFKKSHCVYSICGIGYYYVLVIQRFITMPSSLYRMSNLWGILSSIMALLFLTAFVRMMYCDFDRALQRRIFYLGLTTFLMCFCLTGADVIYKMFAGTTDMYIFLQDMCLAPIGILGATCAMGCCKEEHDEVLEEEVEE